MAGVEMQDFSLRRKQYDKREVCEFFDDPRHHEFYL